MHPQFVHSVLDLGALEAEAEDEHDQRASQQDLARVCVRQLAQREEEVVLQLGPQPQRGLVSSGSVLQDKKAQVAISEPTDSDNDAIINTDALYKGCKAGITLSIWRPAECDSVGAPSIDNMESPWLMENHRRGKRHDFSHIQISVGRRKDWRTLERKSEGQKSDFSASS